jgi:hypothetical protein
VPPAKRCAQPQLVEQQATGSGRYFTGNTQWQLHPYPAD